MKPKRFRKSPQTTTIQGNWIDTDDLVKDGEMKEITEGFWAVNTGVVLDPPEPIKKNDKPKPPRRQK